MKRPAVLIALVALLLRAVAWHQLSGTPFWSSPVVDASMFDLWARDVLTDGGVMSGVWSKPPLYAYLLVGLYGFFGASIAQVQVLQMGAGIATALLVWVVARRLFSPGPALAAGLITASLPMLPFFESQLLAEPWTTLLMLAALERLLPVGGGGVVPASRGRRITAGILLGMAALGRPNLLAVIPAVAVWEAWDGGRPRRWRRAGPLLLAALVTVSMATVRNAAVSGDFVPVSANLGPNLEAGNSDRADGFSAIPVGLLWDDLQLQCRQAGHESTVAMSRYLTGRSADWVVENPGRAASLLGRRLLALVTGWEIRNNIGPRWLAREHGVTVLARWWPSTWLLLPFGMLGLAVAVRGRGLALLATVAAVHAATLLPFFVNARFRQPLLPLLAIFAVAGVVWLSGRWRRGERRAPAAALVLLLAFGVLVNVDWLGLSASRYDAEDAYNEALIELRGYEGRAVDPKAAERLFQRAIALDPDFPDSYERYGALLLGSAQSGTARLQELLRRGDTAAAGGLADRIEAQLAAAADQHRHALRLVPRAYRSAANLGVAALLQGDLDAARANAAGADAVALRRRAAERYREARAHLGRSLRLNPGFTEAKNNLRLLGTREAALAGGAER